MIAWSALIAVALALTHLLAASLRFIHLTPRSRWLSFASGVSVAFVFLELLPHVHRAHAGLRDAANADNSGFYPSYALAMVGLIAFYGMEVAMRDSSRRRGAIRGVEARSDHPTGMFILHVGAFALYNMVIGALIVRQIESGPARQALFFVALGMHMLVNDFALREHHEREYHRYGRWALAAAVLIGWSASALGLIPEVAISVLVALLTGAIMLNVLKEELPEDRNGRFGAFVAGAAAFAVLLLLATV